MRIAPTFRPFFWRREHHLDRMSFKELVVAYFQHPAIIAYLLLAAAAMAAFAWRPAPLAPTLASIVAASLAYPFFWYLIHRYVLHSSWMWKHKALAGTWKRIHFDHHQDPNRLEVLFGALHTTLPTIAIGVFPIGYAIGALWAGPYAALGTGLAALANGLITTCVYEFVHCIQHLSYKPKQRWLAEMKKSHMAHHFHDETGNFGITNYFWDRIFGTYYDRTQGDRPAKSPTVFNLGYTPEVARDYPYVAELSGGVPTGHPRRRDKA